MKALALVYFMPLMLMMPLLTITIRAIDKENKKFRDDARRKYRDQVRALAAFVRKQDPRVARLEAERREAHAREQASRAAAMLVVYNRIIIYTPSFMQHSKSG
jgi:DnaJ family protein A protein 5